MSATGRNKTSRSEKSGRSPIKEKNPETIFDIMTSGSKGGLSHGDLSATPRYEKPENEYWRGGKETSETQKRGGGLEDSDYMKGNRPYVEDTGEDRFQKDSKEGVGDQQSSIQRLSSWRYLQARSETS